MLGQATILPDLDLKKFPDVTTKRYGQPRHIRSEKMEPVPANLSLDETHAFDSYAETLIPSLSDEHSGLINDHPLTVVSDSHLSDLRHPQRDSPTGLHRIAVKLRNRNCHVLPPRKKIAAHSLAIKGVFIKWPKYFLHKLCPVALLAVDLGRVFFCIRSAELCLTLVAGS